MPTATIGNPQTIALGAADALIVSCSAVDAVASVAGSTGFIGAPYELGRVVGETGKKFGPYGRSVSLIVSALAGSITAEVSQPSRVGDGADALSTQQGAAAQGVVSGAWNGPAPVTAGGSKKITVSNGRVLTGGQSYRGVFINAHDQLTDSLTPAVITGVTQANPGVITTSAAHGLNPNDPVAVAGIVGMTQLAGSYFVNTAPSGTTLTLKDAAGIPVNTSGFTAWSSGGTINRMWYTQDLPAIAASGVRLIRVAMANWQTAAGWQAQVGTNGAAPVATFLPALRAFLDACQANNIGVILAVFWSHQNVPLALSRTQDDYLTPGSVTRAYMKTLAATVAQSIKDHPALAAWQIGNEWYDYTITARMATTATDPSKDHLGALVGTINDIVDGIRTWDIDRAIISPSGSGGRYEAGNPRHYLRKFVTAAGKCDLVDCHYYPDADRSGYSHFGAGRAPNMGTGDLWLPMLRNAVQQAGKALIVCEVAGDDDNSTYGNGPTGTLSLTSWTKAHTAGVELVGDWGWYADPVAFSGSQPNLKILRNSVMPKIAAYNATVSGGYVAPPASYPAMGAYPLPARCARGTGGSTGFIRIPNHPDLSPDLTSTARFSIMFWLRRRAVLNATQRIFANNDGQHGVLLTSSPGEGLNFQIGHAGNYTSASPSGQFLNWPADFPVDPMMSYPGEWAHIAIEWDGTPTPAPADDGLQHITLRLNGFTIYRVGYTGKVATAANTRDMFLMTQSDGLGNWSPIDMFDFMTGKGLVTDQQLADYLRFGSVPPAIQHRWKLNGDTQDSIGTLHAVAAAGITFVANGVGNQT